MEATRSSETSVNSYQTTRNHIPEYSNLHSRRRENLKYHVRKISVITTRLEAVDRAPKANRYTTMFGFMCGHVGLTWRHDVAGFNMNNPRTVPHHTISMVSVTGSSRFRALSMSNSVTTSLWVILVQHTNYCNVIVLGFIATKHGTIATLISDILYM
jgi:hypothetical protein